VGYPQKGSDLMGASAVAPLLYIYIQFLGYFRLNRPNFGTYIGSERQDNNFVNPGKPDQDSLNSGILISAYVGSMLTSYSSQEGWASHAHVSHSIFEHEIITLGERKVILDVAVKHDMERSALQHHRDLVLLSPKTIQSRTTEPGPFLVIMKLPLLPWLKFFTPNLGIMKSAFSISHILRIKWIRSDEVYMCY
jgi:hypothetical protein